MREQATRFRLKLMKSTLAPTSTRLDVKLRATMLADLDLALKQPLQLIEKLYVEGSSNLDQFEHRVESTFSTLLKDARDQVSQIYELAQGRS